MQIGRPDGWHRDLRILWGPGVIASSTDAELLDRYARRRDEASEVAFESLVRRHGPLVLGTCLRVLGPGPDAEDAFQATFLVLARKAGSLRVADSLGPWLHEVARRVSLDARASALRRSSRIDPLADPSAVPARPAPFDDTRAVIDEEIARLPELFRRVVILCDLDGLTLDEAARQLRCPPGTVRSRLARVRDRLRSRLARRGLAPTADVLPSPPTLVPAGLITLTTRCAVGRAAPPVISALAKGMIMSLLLQRIRTAGLLSALLAAIGLGGLAASAQRPEPPAVPKSPPVVAPAPAKPKSAFRLEGSVRVEGTGDPVPGGTITVLIGDSGADKLRMTTAGADGLYRLDLPPGYASAWTFRAPPGYWAPRNLNAIEPFVLNHAEPVHRKDYIVRRGTVWPLRILDPASRQSGRGAIASASRLPDDFFVAESDDAGLVRLTLPTEACKLTAGVVESKSSWRGTQFPLEWADGFRPGTVKAVEHQDDHFRLTDADGRVAILGVVVGVEPVVEAGGLVIRATLPAFDPKSRGDLAGRVFDAQGHPLPGARVAIAFHQEKGGSAMTGEDRHRVLSDAQGRYLLQAIPRTIPGAGLIRLSLVVTKDGFAALDTPVFPFRPGDDGAPQAAADLTLQPGVFLSGIVVDPDDQPAVGVWVSPGDGYALREQFTRTDERGQFTLRNLPADTVRLQFTLGDLTERGAYVADGNPDPIKIRLRRSPTAARPSKPVVPEPRRALAIGQAAPEWSVSEWTDGKPRTLADCRGSFVYLNFWNDSAFEELAGLDRLRRKFEPRGVLFLTIHTSDGSLTCLRRLLDLKKATLVSALDLPGKGPDADSNGVTAGRYGVLGCLTPVLIDREGRVAWHSQDRIQEKIAAMKALGKEMGF